MVTKKPDLAADTGVITGETRKDRLVATRDAAKTTKLSDLIPMQNRSGAINRYRKIPEEAEAVQFLGWSNANDIFSWLDGLFYVGQGYEHALRAEDEFDISSGTVRPDAPEFLVFKGDRQYRVDLWTWVVRTEKGQVYFYSPEQFESTYQERVL